jgi:hypothetical protein
LQPLDLSTGRVSYDISDDDDHNDVADDDDDDTATRTVETNPAAVFQTLARYGARTFQDRQGFVAVSHQEEHAILNAEWAEICLWHLLIPVQLSR